MTNPMTSQELNSRLPYATTEELDWLRGYAYAHFEVESVVVILGAGPGVMLLAIKEGRRGVHVTIVDKDTTHYAQAHLNAAGLDFNVRYIVGDSAMAANYWTYPDIDLLVIDADHSYRGVKRDLTAWLPFVKPDGVIFFHDFDADGTIFAGQERYPGVRQAVEEFIPHGSPARYIRAGTAAIVPMADLSRPDSDLQP